MHPTGVEPDSISGFPNSTLELSSSSVGAESGAVSQDDQNLEVLAALVGVLTPEQKAAFLTLLSSPKSGGMAGS